MVHEAVIGIDGGGSKTRVMVSDLAGHILSYAEGGPSSIHKDGNAHENVQKTIQAALSTADCGAGQVKGIYAGIAGYESEQDLKWVQRLTEVEGLHCPKWYVNDSVVAHAGAFLGKPSIVVVSGTGSIIFAVTEQGDQLKNIDFHHYASSAARFLSYDAIFELLAGNIQRSDEAMICKILSYWNVENVDRLRTLAARGFIEDGKERDKKFGEMASIVTNGAQEGSRLGQIVCDKAIDQIMVGVEILGAFFQSDLISVTGIGSVIKSPYMKSKFIERLQTGKNKRYCFKNPELSAVSGAVLMALRSLDIPVDLKTIESIRNHPHSTW
ncbi:BadF/BadG/BcrA/BcrD ATPase family protein [Paenibacillus sp. DMB20]|uniref:BadF/BadG/BcrA/BcrD ATPase family protein n=1 Tax=Paenibacillus sp. DMB20 TaxID=1642570 RepID=UPI00062774B9|nr:BadF/BadG/BcrA/BcrD ATPase family protein [Paenibacillus sp. DMB20]KKO55307.1 ATPase [Paenibacillus sp. DMB20]